MKLGLHSFCCAVFLLLPLRGVACESCANSEVETECWYYTQNPNDNNGAGVMTWAVFIDGSLAVKQIGKQSVVNDRAGKTKITIPAKEFVLNPRMYPLRADEGYFYLQLPCGVQSVEIAGHELKVESKPPFISYAEAVLNFVSIFNEGGGYFFYEAFGLVNLPNNGSGRSSYLWIMRAESRSVSLPYSLTFLSDGFNRRVKFNYKNKIPGSEGSPSM